MYYNVFNQRIRYMKIFFQLLILPLYIFIGNVSAQSTEISIIPRPVQLEKTTGSFSISKATTIMVENPDPESLRVARMFADRIQTAGGMSLKVVETKKYVAHKDVILFTTTGSDATLGKEGYQLSVSRDNVKIMAPTAAGLFYGMQTVFQMLPAEIEGDVTSSAVKWQLPGVVITDKPRFGWRGMHLDVARHFVPVEFVKKYVDNLAMHKLNTFHWHLTDDQGWRIEIKKYPKLTEVGAWRKETLIGHNRDKPHKFDGIRHGGFYTQEQALEIVQYAKERFITVVPEIEMPGHAKAAIASYPELGVTGKSVEVGTHWGVFPDIFNVEESTFSFLEDVLTEVIDIFPSEYIHIGGDEAIKDQWKASDRIQQRIKELGLKDEHELQSYFITRMEKFINSKGRKMIGWDEILEGGLAPNATVMSWQGEEGGIAAAQANHDVIMTPIQSLYFWWYQGDKKTEPLAAGRFISLEKVYRYDPVPSVLTPEQGKHILGAQACAWAEYMESPAKVEYMVFPRISALAEIVWSPKEGKNWNDFKSRMAKQFKRYDQRKINYAKVSLDIGTELKND
jgi:hexosaminidase